MLFDKLDHLIVEKYRAAVAALGDLGIDFPRFKNHLLRILQRYLHAEDTIDATTAFFNALHTNDLLLASACAAGSESAWQQFRLLYCKYLADLGRCLAGNALYSAEVAETVWIDLFLPDRTGISRIASYDGRSSLATWLRVVVANRLINERQRKDFKSGNLDGMPEPADPSALENVQSRLERHRYKSMILDTFRRSFGNLTAHERLLVLLRYDQDLPLGEIARLFSVHQSTITRQLDRTLNRLRSEVISLLTVDYRLGAAAIEECLRVALDTFSTSISILGLVQDGTSAGQPLRRVSSDFPVGLAIDGRTRRRTEYRARPSARSTRM